MAETNGTSNGHDAKERAEALKAEGNAHFQAGRNAEAVEKYNEAIELNPEVPAYYTNRAFCHLKMENHGLAIADATVALELDKTFVKAYYRRGSAYFALGKYKDALKDLKSVRQLKPSDKDALEKYKACEKEVRREAFEKAIHSDEPTQTPISEQIDVDGMAVEDSYDGPRPPWPLTHEACLDIARHLKAQKKLHRKFAFQILKEAKAILSTLPSLVDVPVAEGAHINVCGDTHGQYYDLLNIFETHGFPSDENPYLFNGDFVDRGSFSLEVVLLLLTFKVLYPGHVHLSRGNHETLNMNKIYGFEGEVRQKFSQNLCDVFRETFCWLPVGHVLNGKVYVVHGGLYARDGVTLDELRAIDRNREPADEGLLCESLWSDPQPEPGRAPSKRGVGVAFGPDVTQDFLKTNDLSLVVRSHEVKDAGYEVAHGGYCVTIFSAPNYCDQMGNKGAFIRFEADMVPKFVQFSAVPHPPVRPMAYASNYMSMMQGF